MVIYNGITIKGLYDDLTKNWLVVWNMTFMTFHILGMFNGLMMV